MGIKLIKKTNEARTMPMGKALVDPRTCGFLIDCGDWRVAQKLSDAVSEVAWKPNGAQRTDILGGELSCHIAIGPFYAATIDPPMEAAAWCEEWLRNAGDAAPAIQGNSAGLESNNEDRRGKDRYGHSVRRFTAKDLQGVGGDGADGGDGDNAHASNEPKKFGLAYLNTTSLDAFDNSHDSHKRDLFLHDLADMPVSKDSIEKLLKKYPLRKYGNYPVLVRDFFPENGVAYLGTMGPDGVPYKTLALRWGPALKR